MELSFTEKKSIRKSFGKFKESISIPNLIEVQKRSYQQFLSTNDPKKSNLKKGFQKKKLMKRRKNLRPLELK